MKTTKVIHVDDMPNYPDAIYIGRSVPRKGLKASRFANPYRIGAPASHWAQKDPITREGALFAYATDLYTEKVAMLAELPELRGKPLACWCRHDGEPFSNGSTVPGPDNRCHGDILVNLLETCTDNQLRRWAERGHFDPTDIDDDDLTHFVGVATGGKP